MARQCKCTASLMQCTATCTASVVETFEYIWKEMTAISRYTNQSICVTECLEICKAVLLRLSGRVNALDLDQVVDMFAVKYPTCRIQLSV